MKYAAETAFCLGIVVLSWHGMMAVHELGHVIGGLITGGRVTQVVLHPLQISRTRIDPNPHPGTVVWLGPITGCALPVLMAVLATGIVGRDESDVSLRFRRIAGRFLWFFAGFCLVANGVYLVFGAADGVGDCGEILRTGTPAWVLYAFGSLTIPSGLLCWHRLGRITQLFESPPQAARLLVVWVTVSVVFTLELWLSG